MRDWLNRLADRFAPPRARPTEAPAGLSVYAIGDIHGEVDLARQLVERIREDAATLGAKTKPIIIFLGDYVDRGRDSRGVLDYLIGDPAPWARVHHLRGNHEAAMADFLVDPQRAAPWLAFGGVEALASFGLRAPLGHPRPEQLAALRDAFEKKISAAQNDFLSSLEMMRVYGDYVFVHAGIKPGRSLSEQTPEDLMWIRDEFTRSRRIHEKRVVHGHTVVLEPDVRPNRIGIDTGAYATGILTAIALRGSDSYVIQARE